MTPFSILNAGSSSIIVSLARPVTFNGLKRTLPLKPGQ